MFLQRLICILNECWAGQEVPSDIRGGLAETGLAAVLPAMQRLHPRRQVERRTRPHSLVCNADQMEQESFLQ